MYVAHYIFITLTQIFEWCEFMKLTENDNVYHFNYQNMHTLRYVRKMYLRGAKCYDVHTYMYNYMFSHEAELSEEECAMFIPLCRTINLPVQQPIYVSFSKKVTIVEEPTGRVIELKTRTPELDITVDYTCCTFVSFSSQFGCIDKLFEYRETKFAVVTKFDCSVCVSNGLVNLVDTTMRSQAICQLKEISRPLVVAVEYGDNPHDQLWILNAHTCQ